MSATFDPTLPSARDRLRLLLGDYDTANALRDDETYDGAIAAYGEPGAAAYLADGLAAEYAQYPVTTSADGTSLDFSERVKTWQALAATMRTSPPAGAASGAAFGTLLTSRATGMGVDEYGRPTNTTGRRWWP